MATAGKGIELEEGWAFIMERGFVPLEECLNSSADYRSTFRAQDWMLIYTTVYNMCTQRHPASYVEELYEHVRGAMCSYLNRTALPSLKKVHGPFMLDELVRRWNNHYIMVRWIKKIFDYLDRFHVKRAEKLPLQALGSQCFLQEVFLQVKGDVRSAVLDMIYRERQGEFVDRSLLKSVVFIYVEMSASELDVYIEELENPFLKTTAEYYQKESAVWADQCSFPEFLLKAELCVEAENGRRVAYLHAHTYEGLMRVCETEILGVHQATMLAKENSGLVALLEQDKRDDLSRLYRLYSSVNMKNRLQPIAQMLSKHIEKDGFQLVNEYKARIAREEEEHAAGSSRSEFGGGALTSPAAAQLRLEPAVSVASLGGTGMDVDTGTTSGSVSGLVDGFTGSAAGGGAGNTPLIGVGVSSADRSEFIVKLLALHERYYDLVINCFGDSLPFHKAMKEAFEAFLNFHVGKTSSAELFANYCDSLLSVGGIGARMGEDQVEDQLERIVRLFNFLTEKDVFSAFARKQLAKRLLLEKSHSDDAERSLIAKLKLRCGAHYTSKLEGMITDMNLSRDMQRSFRRWFEDRKLAIAEGRIQEFNMGGTTPASTPAVPVPAPAPALVPAPVPAPAPGHETGTPTGYARPASRVVLPMSTPPVPPRSAPGPPVPPPPAHTLPDVALSPTERASVEQARDPVAKPSRDFQLVATSEEISDMESSASTVNIEGVECSVRVLTSGHWPSYKDDRLTLPMELERCITSFREYYDQKTSQRILRWVHPLGKCQVDTAAYRTNAKVPRVELQVSTHQACILVQYNYKDELTFKQILDALGSSDADLVKQFVVSLTKKVALLVRRGKGKDITDDEVFALNTDFKPLRRRITLPTPTARVSQEEKAATQHGVVEDRKHSIEAAIVRVMKQKKQLEHSQLVAEVSRLLMAVFKPDPKQIKTRIEDLIVREYLKRDDNNNSVYEYLA
ncbi:Cullin-1 [Porphyridium purpureum]|uniref:Cullin-1 n=1 Tax=Porphyridium purpureum TaxID=35688 RepID=A0A5J4YFW7_PORPP|nr:Cullin-1 [Porphyridium purpureum]KAA8492286.1 Cullin-1 [Porphyridium purpureum]|eukprot:POR1273..scf250_33